MRSTARHRTGTGRCGSIGGRSAGPIRKVSSVVRHYPSPHGSQRRNGTDAIHFRMGDPLDLSPRCAGVSQGTAPPPDVRGDAGDWWWVVLIVLLIGTGVWFFMRRRDFTWALASQQKPHGSNPPAPVSDSDRFEALVLGEGIRDSKPQVSAVVVSVSESCLSRLPRSRRSPSRLDPLSACRTCRDCC